ncbi:SDR family NAD(P)-dependent oxidoreductase [Chryseobacterium gotjawalense]|uniref:SDR family NAD(P)-dependent oxidoreductase n=1 Tax=Chryseobacterium gotjawalense TaxID=3042315 RepID=A0ABY8RFN4_9FLAO|nr:SDR family NAD(P)-dependent oxidoreductase [Chryseobacterium sp. wdc7]WHF52780.1 SDR family NAD(P)-dependent oxidoreductase [Chryseobacterium sp. wdc7]
MENKEINHGELRGKTVVITGGTSGVGKAAAEAFALEGCNVVVAARGREGLDETVALCHDLEVVALGVQTDVSDAQQVQHLAEQALQFNGRIDIWINNAGVMASGKFEEIPVETMDQLVKTNLLGFLHGAHTVLPIFKKQKEGILINNISIGGWMPAPYSTAYSSTKFGIRGMVEGLQGEVSDEPNIHIVGLYPGIQRSTGNMHSAKYSGLDFKIPPFSSDPRELAAKMVEAAKNPKKSIITDGYAHVMKVLYGLFPKTIINTASAVLRLAMKPDADTNTDGNVNYQSKDPMRIYGELAIPVPSRKTKTVMMMAAGIALGFLYIKSKKR